MIQRINILLLILFINFLAFPTIAYCMDIDVNLSGINYSEEEENHVKKNNNSLSEEEVHFIYTHQFYELEKFAACSGKFDKEFNLSIKDPIVQKIPLPPPEQI